MSIVLQVNLAVPENPDVKHLRTTGITKRPVDHPVQVTAPAPRGGLAPDKGSGLAGDFVFDSANHGGADQAVYAYAREDYDWWEKELERDLPGGIFGENLTTRGIDLGAVEIGEAWRIGETLVLQATFGRVPCATFQWKMGEPRWVKRFAAAARTGVYLRVVTPGPVRAGDPIEVLERPGHGLTIGESFVAYLRDPATLLPWLDRVPFSDTIRGDLRRKLKL